MDSTASKTQFSLRNQLNQNNKEQQNPINTGIGLKVKQYFSEKRYQHSEREKNNPVFNNQNKKTFDNLKMI